MRLSDFDYELPDELIARYPTDQRTQSRLMIVGEPNQHQHFYDLPQLLKPGDLLVMNHSKVLAARLFGKKPTGGKLELLCERVLGERTFLAHMKVSHLPPPGMLIELEGGYHLRHLERQGNLFVLEIQENLGVLELLERIGHIPLPPYMNRPDEVKDRERYQTVYAKRQGSVAAPTAGLHFDQALLDTLEARGVDTAFVTLHVGAGTFQNIRVENIMDHHMHAEWIEISEEVCAKVTAARMRGGRVIAVGTTSLRALESASRSGRLLPYTGETKIFIYPGFVFHTVDALITNFHLPKSSLLLLVSAFLGREKILAAYQEAIALGYRFFSYGDAMFLC